MSQVRSTERYTSDVHEREVHRPFFYRFMTPFFTLLSLAATAFGAYVAIDEDLRTLVWKKWNQNIEYRIIDGDENINFNLPGDRDVNIDVP